MLGAAPANAATLVHWWKAEDNANDSQPAANHGALNGNTAFVTGQVGKAFSFDGDNDYVSVPDSPDHYPSGSFTVDAYAKTTDAVNSNQIAQVYECANSCPSGTASSLWEIQITAGDRETFMRERTAAVVGVGLMEKFGWQVGQKIVLQGTYLPGDWEFTIRAAYTPTDPALGDEMMLFHYEYFYERSNGQIGPGWFILQLERPDRAACLPTSTTPIAR